MQTILPDIMCAGGDSGFGAIKTDISDGKGFRVKLAMPSTISEAVDRTMALISLGGNDPINMSLSPVENQLNVLDVDILNVATGETNSWFMGRLAIKEGRNTEYCWLDDKSADKKSMALLLTQLALAQTAKAEGKNSFGKFFLTTGLPVKHFTKYHESYVKNIKGQWRVTFKHGIWKGVSTTVDLGSCKVYPQAYGIWNDYVMDMGGGLANAGLLDDYVLVVDVGTRTTDYAVFKEGTMLDGFSGSEELGMSNVLETLLRRLKSMDIVVKDHDVDYCFIEHGGWIRGKNLNHDKLESLKLEAEEINNQLKKRLKVAWDQIGITLIGGRCGEEMFNYLQFPKKTLTPNAQFGNATGFLKFGMEMVSSLVAQKRLGS